MDQAALIGGFLTVLGTIFVAELTDKDALLVLALATRMRALKVFLAGSVAFTITTAIIVSVGSVLVTMVPIFWIKVAGGLIMIVYATWEYWRQSSVGEEADKAEEKILDRSKAARYEFVAMVVPLILLDLAGDATEVLTVVFVAQIGDPWVVFSAAVIALVAATAVETALGNRLRRVLSAKRVGVLSALIFFALGSLILVSSFITV